MFFQVLRISYSKKDFFDTIVDYKKIGCNTENEFRIINLTGNKSGYKNE